MEEMTSTMPAEHQNKVGELLKQGRLRQRLSVGECAKRTHIAARFIEALEEERWDVLPSESHRLGFLKLYSRFLGVSVDDVLGQYQKQLKSSAASAAEKPAAEYKPEPSVKIRTAPRAGWSPSSLPQLFGLSILLLVLGWLLYHMLRPYLSEQNQMPWMRQKMPTEARLSVPARASQQTHKIRLQAVYDCWLRVTSNHVLLFEGILPANAIKEWSGAGPFDLKIGNVKALQLFWNEQSVDISAGSQGSTNKIRIPPQ